MTYGQPKATTDKTKEELEAEVARLQKRLNDFSAEVVEAAVHGKRVNGWCSEIDRIIEKLGLSMADSYGYRAKVTIEIEFEANAKYHTELPPKAWVKNQIGIQRAKSPVTGREELAILFGDNLATFVDHVIVKVSKVRDSEADKDDGHFA